MNFIEVTREDGSAVAVVTMKRPEKRNALSLDVMRELIATFEGISARGDTGAVILRGEGPAFSAGHDLRELQCEAPGEQDRERFDEIFATCVQLMETIQSIPQPVIAEIAAIATAAGCQLVATCDLAVASSEARFATPGVRIGLFCTTPMVALSRAIGRKRAMEMLLTGEFIDAETALSWGLVNRVVSPERLHGEALDLARKIGLASRRIVAIGKQAFYRQADLSQEEAYRYAQAVMTENALNADAREGIGAFIERRPAVWR